MPYGVSWKKLTPKFTMGDKRGLEVILSQVKGELARVGIVLRQRFERRY